jgi:hypothetical protein
MRLLNTGAQRDKLNPRTRYWLREPHALLVAALSKSCGAKGVLGPISAPGARYAVCGLDHRYFGRPSSRIHVGSSGQRKTWRSKALSAREGAEPGGPPRQQRYHSGLVLPRASVATLAAAQGQSAVVAVARRFAAYDWVEVGWGEARSYREVPTIDRLSWRLALSALFGPNNEAVLHVVGLWDEPQEVFRGAERVSLRISAEGAARLLARSRSVPRVSRRNSVQGSTDQACSIGRRAASTSSMFATIGLRISSTLQAFQPLPCWRRCRGAWCWIFAGDPS